MPVAERKSAEERCEEILEAALVEALASIDSWTKNSPRAPLTRRRCAASSSRTVPLTPKSPEVRTSPVPNTSCQKRLMPI